MIEKVLVAFRDWMLWEKAHIQKLLFERALQWLWEERQQSQTGVKIRAIKPESLHRKKNSTSVGEAGCHSEWFEKIVTF